MGCGASAARVSANCPKIKEIKLENVNIPEFDEVFKKCKAPLNTIVGFNNTLMTYLDAVKLRAGLLMEIPKVTVTLEGQEPVADLQKLKDDDFVSCLQEETDKPTNKSVKAAWDKLKTLAKPVADTAAAAGVTDLSVLPDDTLEFKLPEEEPAMAPEEKPVAGSPEEKEAQEKKDKQKAFLDAVDKYNLQLYNVRSELVKVHGPMALSGVVCELKKMLMKLGKGLDFTLDPFGISLPKIDELPKPIGMVTEALEKLGHKMKEIFDSHEKITEEMSELVKQAQEFPNKAKDSLANTEMGPFEIMKAIHAVAMNVKSVLSAPVILATVLSTVKDIPMQLVQGIKDAAAGKSGKPVKAA